MSERIRYSKVDAITVESVQVFEHPTNGARYKIRLMSPSPSEDAYRWFVLDEKTEVVATSGRHVNRTKAQQEVRTALVSLGVKLHTEKRKARAPKSLTV